MNNNFDVVIIGGGMVGLCVAYQLIQSKKARKIVVVDKEKELGLHSSAEIAVFCMPIVLQAKFN